MLPDKHPAIVLPSEVPHSFLPKILEFIYCGKIEIDEQNAQKFYKVLKTLRIPSSTNQDPGQVQVKLEKVEQIEEDEYEEKSNQSRMNDSTGGKFRQLITSSKRYVKVHPGLVQTLAPKNHNNVTLTFPSKNFVTQSRVKHGSFSPTQATKRHATSPPLVNLIYPTTRTRIEDVVKTEDARWMMDKYPERYTI